MPEHIREDSSLSPSITMIYVSTAYDSPSTYTLQGALNHIVNNGSCCHCGRKSCSNTNSVYLRDRRPSRYEIVRESPIAFSFIRPECNFSQDNDIHKSEEKIVENEQPYERRINGNEMRMERLFKRGDHTYCCMRRYFLRS